MHLRKSLVAFLLLSACVSVQEWEIFSDRAVNITFAHDPAYVRDTEVTREDIQFGDKKIAVASIALRKGEAESSFMQVLQTKDPMILSYLLSNSPTSERVLIDGTDAQVFREQGMGDAVRYLFQKGDLYIVLSFVFPPAQRDIERTLSSVVLRP